MSQPVGTSSTVTRKQLAADLSVHVRTIQRNEARYGLTAARLPVDRPVLYAARVVSRLEWYRRLKD